MDGVSKAEFVLLLAALDADIVDDLPSRAFFSSKRPLEFSGADVLAYQTHAVCASQLAEAKLIARPLASQNRLWFVLGRPSKVCQDLCQFSIRIACQALKFFIPKNRHKGGRLRKLNRDLIYLQFPNDCIAWDQASHIGIF